MDQRALVRDLAKRVAEVAALPIQQKTLQEWKALNALSPSRPMFMLDQLPWEQLLCEELKCECEDGYLRSFEHQFRTVLYRWNHIQDDKVIFPEVRLFKAANISPHGIEPKQKYLDGKDGADIRAHVCEEDRLQGEGDIENIKYAEVSVDENATRESFSRARELFDGILKVRQAGIVGYGAAWDRISLFHGVENSITDLIDRPGFVHKYLEKMLEVMCDELDQCEKSGLIGVGEPYIHYGGAFTDELPGYNGESEGELEAYRYSAKYAWTMGMAQIFSMVSPEIHREFEIEYQKRYYARFGLGYYGCCEPLDMKIDIIKEIPNVRKISMSPWVDMERGSEAMGGGYVFSRKPNPAFLANDAAWQPELVRRDLEEACLVSAKYGNPCELILKDVSTVGHKPERLWEWAKIAAAVCGREQSKPKGGRNL